MTNDEIDDDALTGLRLERMGHLDRRSEYFHRPSSLEERGSKTCASRFGTERLKQSYGLNESSGPVMVYL